MSGLFRAVTPRSFPVKLGDLTFHATGWKLSGSMPSKTVYRAAVM